MLLIITPVVAALMNTMDRKAILHWVVYPCLSRSAHQWGQVLEATHIHYADIPSINAESVDFLPAVDGQRTVRKLNFSEMGVSFQDRISRETCNVLLSISQWLPHRWFSILQACFGGIFRREIAWYIVNATVETRTCVASCSGRTGAS